MVSGSSGPEVAPVILESSFEFKASREGSVESGTEQLG